MPTQYRTLQPNEEDAVLRLWAELLEDDVETRALIFHDFADEPLRFARTHVAVANDGTLLSAAAYWVREVYDFKGNPCRTGHLWGVATRPEARRQGHARKLLDLTVNAMQQEGCQWTILFAREETRTLYTQAGWQVIPHQYRAGILTDAQPQSASQYQIQTWEPNQYQQDWARLAKIYADENRQRPLTMIRNEAYWQGYVAWMLADWIGNHRAVVLVATPEGKSDEWCGYVIAHYYDAAYAEQTFGSPPWFFISEIGALTQNQEVTRALLGAVKVTALRQGMRYGQMVLPDEPHINATLQEIFGDTLETYADEGSAMIRTISPTTPTLQRSPEVNSFLWSIDQF